MLIEDFGDKAYQFSINRSNFHHLFSSAIDEMVNINKCPQDKNLSLLSRKDLRDQITMLLSILLNKDSEVISDTNETSEFSSQTREAS